MTLCFLDNHNEVEVEKLCGWESRGVVGSEGRGTVLSGCEFKTISMRWEVDLQICINRKALERWSVSDEQVEQEGN